MIFGFLPSFDDRGAHRREIHEQRHAGEILQHDARDDERDFLRARRLRDPPREVADRGLGHALAVAVAQQRFQHEPDRDGQARDLEAGFFQRGQRVELVRRAVGGKRLERVEGIREGHVIFDF